MDCKISTDGKRLLKVYVNDKSFIIPKGVTTINTLAFVNCFNLEYLEGQDVTIIRDNAFWCCHYIKKINFPKVKKIGTSNFYDTKLTNVSLPNVTILGDYSFGKSNILKIINIPKLKDIGSKCFEKCKKLHTINSNLSKEQLKIAFNNEENFNNYLQRSRVIKLKNI